MTAPGPGRPSLRRDQSGFIRGLIIRTVISLAVLAIAGYDGARLVMAQARAESVSRVAATVGADTYFRLHRADLAQRDAIDAARAKDPTAVVTDVQVRQDGVVVVTVAKTADTLVVRRVGFLKKYNTQTASDDEIRTS